MRKSNHNLGNKKLIPDHKVHFVEANNENIGYALAGLLNFTSARTYVSSYVIRTGAQYCDYPSWIIGHIPVSEEILKGGEELAGISKKLHEVKDGYLLEKLDKKVADFYSPSAKELSIMRDFLEFL